MDEPIIVSLDDRFLVWDKDHWITKRPLLGQKRKHSEIIPQGKDCKHISTCWCGAKIFVSQTLSSEMQNEHVRRFKSDHKLCGKRKNKTVSPIEIIYNIKEEEGQYVHKF